jgi:hypothetical protein
MGANMHAANGGTKKQRTFADEFGVAEESILGDSKPAATFATTQECIDAYIETKSVAKAASAVGVREDTLRKRLKKEATKKGFDDIRMFHTADLSVAYENNITQSSLVRKIEEQGFRCKLSGVLITTGTASLDHLVPVSKGGAHTNDNVAWVHSEINRMKGQLSLEEFVAWCAKVVQYTR